MDRQIDGTCFLNNDGPMVRIKTALSILLVQTPVNIPCQMITNNLHNDRVC